MTGGASLTAAVGVVQFTIYDAKDLKNSELVGNSDPYIKLRLGNRPDLAVTEVKNDTLNPVWNETNIILVNNLNEVVCMEIMDKDNLRKDRPLGQANFDLKSLEEDPIQDDVWCKVLRNGKERGAVRIRAAYFPVQQPKALEEGGELVPIESNSGILAINLAQAKDIARSGKTKSLCQISLNGRIIHTTRKMLGANPAWGADVDAFITDLAGSQFLVEVVSEGSVIGSYNVSGTQLLKDTADKTEWASLKGSEGTGKLKMTGIWKPILMGEDMNPVAHKPAFGVMRVQVVAGRDLRNVEIGGSSDPYVVIVGDKGVSRGCTKTIDSNLNPVWDEIFYVSVNSMRQVLEFETFDFQKMTKDRSLGKTSFKVSEVIEELPDKAGYKARPTFDRWEPLKQKDGSTKGDLHLVISFFPSHKLAQEATADAQAGVAPITAPLPEGTIYASRALDYDSGILVAHLTTGELDRSGTYCEFYVDSDTYQYKSQMQKSRTPKWNEVADLFVKELEYAKLTILVKEKSAMDKDLIVGTFSSNIRSLMETTPVEGGSFVVLDGASKRGSLQLRFEYFPVPIELLPKERLDNMGNMTVTLVRAKNLAAADRGGSSDPYVVFRVNDKEVFKSDVVKKSLDPDFNETFVTPIASRAEDIFTFEVFDWNQIAAAKSLGVGSLDLRSLQLVLPNTFDIPLKGKFNQGNVYLRVKFVPEFLSSNKRKSGFGATFLGGGVNLVGQAGAAGVGAMAGGVGAVGKGALNVTGAVGKGALDVTGAVGKGALDVTGAVGKGALDVTGAVGKGALKGVGAVGKGVFGGLAAGASAVGLNRRSDSTSQSKGSPPQSQGANVEQSITSMGPGQIVTEEEVLVLDLDRGGMSDPYVKVRLGDQTVLKTKVKKETLSPVWNESVVIPGNTSQPLRLVFSVKDHNKIGSDVDLGDCELDLWNYIQPGQGQNRSDFWATLAGSGGRLRLALEFEAGGSASSPVESRRSGLLSRK
ncbi:hypothetical protein BGW38_000755 [Lunasporangiospora selenospora]|uniref:C2 domain-containing protein n=1 Tax=Lunasporangiospora selenospora TaxID=979761 RepID=A0A9P6KEK9_9FUNG|nr:hypothetical protein BGW38_000755 [Lunasporangiospora selenospora]